ncbi:MAG: helix-turn-helix domain-containing protein, partial [Lachnospiraceae bacterium]|nr:helix-turn-helix domain-containing protein [Lachnospiraceae bacterium]
TPHSHPHCELYYLISGGCTMLAGQTNYTLTPGMILIIPSNVPHKTTYVSTTSERLTVEFSSEYISDIAEEFGDIWMDRFFYNSPIYLPQDSRSHIEHMFTTLMEDNRPAVSLSPENSVWPQQEDIFSDCVRKLHFQEIIIELLRRNTHANYVTAERILISDIAIAEALRYIDANYNEPLTLEGVADMYRLNPSYFSSKFKSVNGIGFKEYHNNVRIVHAEKLLLETDMSITEIAIKCGYETSNYFGDAFRRINNCSPSQFRKMNGNV